MTGFAREWNWPGWTLIIEWAFYLIIALVGSAAVPKVANIFVLTASAYILWWGGLLAESEIYLVSFFMGVALSSMIHVTASNWKAMMMLGVMMVAGLLFWPQLMEGYTHATIKSLAVAILVLAFVAMPPLGGRVGDLLRYMGKISFSLYCWHWPVIVFGCYFLFGRPDMTTLGQVVLERFMS